MVLRSSFSSIPSLRGSWWGITLFSPICVVFFFDKPPPSRRLLPSWIVASLFDVFDELQRLLDFSAAPSSSPWRRLGVRRSGRLSAVIRHTCSARRTAFSSPVPA